MAARRRVVEAPRSRSAPRLESIRVVVLTDEEPDTSYLDPEDAEAALEIGFVGVVAEAEVEIHGVIQTLVSGGLWGIEADSGDYIEEVAQDEYNDLRKILTSVGVSTSALQQKIDRSWIQWRT